MTVDQFIDLIAIIIWPLALLVVYLSHRDIFGKLFLSITKQIEKGGFQVGSLRVGSLSDSLSSPKENEKVDANHIALIHSSWRYEKKDLEYNRKMYGIQVIVQANKAVLARIEYVIYSLHPTYPQPIQKKDNRKNQFELKELAWGEFILRAEVKVEGQNETIHLSRYINLSETGERLLCN